MAKKEGGKVGDIERDEGGKEEGKEEGWPKRKEGGKK